MKSRRQVLIVHFQPTEKYPPIQNLLNFLADREPDWDIKVLTHKFEGIDVFVPKGNVQVKRLKFPVLSLKWGRFWHYIQFTLFAFKEARAWKPHTILYYETDSAMAGFTAHLASQKSKLLIHYHEYNSPQQYKCGMLWIRLAHVLEKNYLWKKATWISHTNELRLKLFQKNYGFKDASKLHTMANYPPNSWVKDKKPEHGKRMVYVGSLGVDNFFVEGLLNFLAKEGKAYTLDIYGHNISAALKELIGKSGLPNISIKPGVPYAQLPEVLSHYNIGLILYKPFNENFRFNETNKLFEYLSGGLEVWYPFQLKGIKAFQEKHRLTALKAFDFNAANALSEGIQAQGDNTEYPINCVLEKEFEKILAVI